MVELIGKVFHERKHLFLAEHCDFKHDTSTQREAPRLPIASGQNLGSYFHIGILSPHSFILGRGYPTWTQAIKFWIDEKNDFTYGSPTQKGVVGHYTQVYHRS